ncbi:hypothetical protein K501DRAFT_266438 [Backusella circina FSU 941]|nr:hypothetical protein K501DRAFT_266438 [Backusella circina FSU 941]
MKRYSGLVKWPQTRKSAEAKEGSEKISRHALVHFRLQRRCFLAKGVKLGANRYGTCTLYTGFSEGEERRTGRVDFHNMFSDYNNNDGALHKQPNHYSLCVSGSFSGENNVGKDLHSQGTGNGTTTFCVNSHGSQPTVTRHSRCRDGTSSSISLKKVILIKR